MKHPNVTALKARSNELNAAVGRAIIAWGMLEIRIDEFLLSMLSHEKARATRHRQEIRTTNDIPKSFGSRLKLCNELAPLFYPGHLVDDVKALTKKCRGQYRTRNRLAHGEWFLTLFRSKKPPQIISRIRRHGLRGTERQFSIKQIDGLTRTYRKLADETYRFHHLNHPEGPPAERLKRFFDSLQRS